MSEIYYPESFPAPPSNREDISSLAALERAMNEGKILKSNVLFCDSSMRLHIDLGGIHGIIERDETVFCRGTEAIKDIAVISYRARRDCRASLAQSGAKGMQRKIRFFSSRGRRDTRDRHAS